MISKHYNNTTRIANIIYRTFTHITRVIHANFDYCEAATVHNKKNWLFTLYIEQSNGQWLRYVIRTHVTQNFGVIRAKTVH